MGLAVLNTGRRPSLDAGKWAVEGFSSEVVYRDARLQFFKQITVLLGALLGNPDIPLHSH